jgi:hypothetical protein
MNNHHSLNIIFFFPIKSKILISRSKLLETPSKFVKNCLFCKVKKDGVLSKYFQYCGRKDAIFATNKKPQGSIQKPILFSRGKATSLDPT